MSRIEVAPEVREDLERILEHLVEFDVAEPSVRINEIIHAISVLEHNPLIGRPVRNDLRELIIGRGAHGNIALYRYLSEIDTVFLLAVRSQQEAGYRRL